MPAELPAVLLQLSPHDEARQAAAHRLIVVRLVSSLFRLPCDPSTDEETYYGLVEEAAKEV